MATLKTTLTLSSTDATSDRLNISVSDVLTTKNPAVKIARASVTTTGANNIIQPNTDQTYYVYIKHTGVDASGTAVTSTLAVEKTGDVVFANLAPGEFAFFPCGGGSHGIQLEAASSTIVAEYAYWAKG